MAATRDETDRTLFDLAREGDDAAFRELVVRHRARLYRLALNMVHSPEDAEDVTQEAFVRAHRALRDFDGRSEPFSWLYRITVNVSLNLIRARKSARVDKSGSLEQYAEMGVLREDESKSPHSLEEQRSFRTALSRGLEELSDTLRTTMLLVCVDGIPLAEAARTLGVPEGTIAWRIHEARKRLRASLAKRGFEWEEDAQ